MARYRTNAQAAFLIKAFSPVRAQPGSADPSTPTGVGNLRCWSAKLTRGGERIRIEFDLPDIEHRRAAAELVKRAPSLRLVAIGKKAIREIAAVVEDGLLKVDALVGRAS